MIALACVPLCSMFKFLGFSAAPAKSKNLNQRLRQIKAARGLPRQLFVVDEITFNILYRLAAGADQVMVRFKIAFHQQRGSAWAYFPQQAVLHEQPQVVVHSSQRDRWSSPPNGYINSFRRIVSWRGHNGLINDLPLMRGRKATLPSQIPKLFVSCGHKRSNVVG
jgi:hypothetical protein